MYPLQQSLLSRCVTMSCAALVMHTATAQDVATTQTTKAAPNVASVMQQSFGIDHVDGKLRAGGPRYKAVFDQAGVEYTPALGNAAPQNYPLRFSLRAIRRGAVKLYDAAAERAPIAQRSGMVASYSRGLSIRETYEARIDGLKQNFTFAQRPAGTGSLVVEGRITTELPRVDHEPPQRGLSFAIAGVGGVRFGEVLGIDADGQTRAGSTSFDGQIVRFQLPAEFVDSARYPLVLDPIITTTATLNSEPAKDPDVAFDETFDQYLVVWEHQFSQQDIDVRGQKVNTLGSLVQSAIFVTNESGNEINPSVANVDAGSDFLVVYQDGPTVFGPWDIRGRRVDGGGATSVSAWIPIADQAANEIDPDVSGDNTNLTGSFDGCIVAYDNSFGIRAVKVDVSTMTIVAGPLTVAININSSASNPAISKSGGASGRHLIVYQQTQGSDHDLRGMLVDRDLNVLSGVVSIETSAANTLDADVDGNGEEWMVVFRQNESGTTGPGDIFCRRVVWTGGQAAPVGSPSPVAALANRDERDPAIGYLGSKYVAAWARLSVASTFNYDIRTVELEAETCTVCGQEQFALGGPSNVVDLNPEIATRYSGRATTEGNLSFDQGMIVWMDTPNTAPFEGDLVANLYEAFTGGTVTDLGGGCGNGGTNGFNGPVALGNDDLELTLVGAGSALTLVSIQFANTFVSCGGCVINADSGSYLFQPATGGVSSFSLPIPCDASFIGTTLFTQWASALSGTSQCVILPPSLELSYSNRLSVTIAP